MRILDFLFPKRPASGATAAIAKERLQLVLAHERTSREGAEMLPLMKRELLSVIAKYVAIKEDMIQVKLGRDGSASVLTINVEFHGGRRPKRARM
jgi:cell division topological specificity factor